MNARFVDTNVFIETENRFGPDVCGEFEVEFLKPREIL